MVALPIDPPRRPPGGGLCPLFQKINDKLVANLPELMKPIDYKMPNGIEHWLSMALDEFVQEEGLEEYK